MAKNTQSWNVSVEMVTELNRNDISEISDAAESAIAAGGGAADANGNYVDGGDYYSTSYGPELMGRNVWFVWNLDDVADGTIDATSGEGGLNTGLEKGSVVKIITNKTNQLADKFTVTAPSVASTNVADDVKKVNVFD